MLKTWRLTLLELTLIVADSGWKHSNRVAQNDQIDHPGKGARTMSRRILLRAFFYVVAVALAFCVLQVTQVSADEVSEREIQALVRQLGDEDFQIRETATRKLSGRRDAISALKRAAKSSDIETATRAKRILNGLLAGQELPRLRKLSGAGDFDLAVDAFALNPKWEDEMKAWQIMAELAGNLSDLEAKLCGKRSLPDDGSAPAPDFQRFATTGEEFRMIIDRHVSGRDLRTYRAIRARDITSNQNVSACFCVAAGPIQAGIFQKSVLFSGTSIKVTAAGNSMLVCDGDVTIDDMGGISSLVIARGDVHLSCRLVKDSRIICTGRVRRGPDVQIKDSKIKENEKKPLGFVRFFDPLSAGISVKTANSDVVVDSVPAGKSFEAAGLRPGDIILSLDGKEPKDPETFRRLLRPKVVESDEMLFRVKRGSERLEIKVQIPYQEEPTKPTEQPKKP